MKAAKIHKKLPKEAPFLAQAYSRWNRCKDSPAKILLRLVILRDLIRALHAERSHHLAHQSLDQASYLRDIEPRIAALGKVDLDCKDLKKLLDLKFIREIRAPSEPPTAPAILNQLSSLIPLEKLTRYDRSRELQIALEAIHCGWKFYALAAWIRIEQIEAFHHQLSEILWPHGAVLFVETDAQSRQGKTWRGIWYLVLEELSVTQTHAVMTLPGIVLDPSGPLWRKLAP